MAWERGWSAIWTLKRVPSSGTLLRQNSCELANYDRDLWPSLAHESCQIHSRTAIESSLDSFFVSLHSKASINTHLTAKVSFLNQFTCGLVHSLPPPFNLNITHFVNQALPLSESNTGKLGGAWAWGNTNNDLTFRLKFNQGDGYFKGKATDRAVDNGYFYFGWHGCLFLTICCKIADGQTNKFLCCLNKHATTALWGMKTHLLWENFCCSWTESL